MNIVASLLLSALTYAVSNGCDTVLTEAGACCVFPFEYNDEKYCECTSNNWFRPWCSLTPFYAGKWGHCPDDQGTTAAPTSLGCNTVQTKEGDCCHFPFEYKGETYCKCTSDNWVRPWCSLTPIYEGMWGHCPDNQPTTTPPVGKTTAPPTTSDIDECANNPCQNGASCIDSQGDYQCICQNGFEGKNCDKDIDECANNPCQNGASCINSQGDYQCACQNGFEGKNCDEDIDECANNPCQNGASCINFQGDYYCACQNGFEGKNCDEDIDECANNPCQNGASCINSQGDYQCVCQNGFEGRNCDEDIDECANNPCQNGASCINLQGDYQCICQNGFEGKNCDEDTQPTTTPSEGTNTAPPTTSDNQPTTATPVGTTAAPPPPTTSDDDCGSRPINTRIVGGTQAQNGSWPWMAMLAYAGGSQFCGGSLIYEQWVLTSAQCLDGLSPSQIVVRMGAYKRTDIAQELQVEQIIIHPSYNNPGYFNDNDIALLKLKTKATLNTGVGKVCLPNKDDFVLGGKICYITGWGTLADGGALPDYLQEASVKTLENADCEKAYGVSAIAFSMICAALDFVGACQGDGGGPMVCEFDGKWDLVGVTSWGFGCADPDYPGVYTRVSIHKVWIDHHVGLVTLL
ncbi:uncharacterized protein LOC144659796 isoform X3 [Oculina patagonica]